MYQPRYSNIRFRKYNNKFNLNNLRKQRPVQFLSSYHKQVKDYIRGLIHPEMAVTGSYVPKAPNYVAIPTSNITFREAFDIQPDANGEFTLYWTPNFLCTNQTLRARARASTMVQPDDLAYSRNWLGGYDNIYKKYCYMPIAAYEPPASFTKYRLVSAGCRITYKGPVINRAGIISHCLSYRAFPVTYFGKNGYNITPAEVLEQWPDMGKSINDISVNSVQNGMWNSVQNVQKNQTTFTVAVPTDPSDFVFEDDGYFYSSSTATEEVFNAYKQWTDGDGNNQQSVYWPQLPEDGTPCSYIFKGTDLTQDAKLYVEQFYNFEVIPTEESAPILRPRQNDLTSRDLENAKSVVNKLLEYQKGNIGIKADDLIDSFLSDSIATDFSSDFISSLPPPSQIGLSNIQNQPQQQQMVYVKKRPKSQSKAKQFLNKTWNGTKNIAKQVFSQKNMENLARIAGQFAAGMAGGKPQ